MVIRTMMQRKNGTNLGCILDVESAGLADELDVDGKGKGNREQLRDFWLLQLVLFMETGKREITICFQCFELPVRHPGRTVGC